LAVPPPDILHISSWRAGAFVQVCACCPCWVGMQVVEKLMMPEHQPPLMASANEVMLPVKDPLFAKHFVLLQDIAEGMEEPR